jgi:hypothetical protein
MRKYLSASPVKAGSNLLGNLMHIVCQSAKADEKESKIIANRRDVAQNRAKCQSFREKLQDHFVATGSDAGPDEKLGEEMLEVLHKN